MVSREIFGHNWLNFLVISSPICHMLKTFGFHFIKLGYIYM